MFKNYLKIAIRNMMRNKLYSVINVMGLSIGIACFILIALWVKDELSYDRQFAHADRIYRIGNVLYTSDIPTAMAGADGRLASFIWEQYPQAGSVTRVLNVPGIVQHGNKTIYEKRSFYVDTSFFSVFSLEFVERLPDSLLKRRQSVVISDKMAIRLFGTTHVLGREVLLNNEKTKDECRSFKIVGVTKSLGRNTHFHPEVMILRYWYLESFEQTYVLLNEGFSTRRFEEEVWGPIYEKYYKDEYHGDKQDLSLDMVPLTAIHLSANVWGDFEQNNKRSAVMIFTAIGLLILVVAAINYTNLATARSYDRAREVGVRQLLGATRRHIVLQFLVESVLVALLAALPALAIVEVALPYFNTLADKAISLATLDGWSIGGVVVTVWLVGVASGIYPAFFIASYTPVKALKGVPGSSGRSSKLRQGLVVVQFALSVIMLIATLVMGRQLDFVHRRNLGFDKEQIIVVNIDDPTMRTRIKELKQKLLLHPGILKVAGSYNIPGDELNHSYLKFQVGDSMKPILINSMFVGTDYPDLLNLELKEGQWFDSSMVPRLDSNSFVLVNESAMKLLGWKHGAGKRVESGYTYGYRQGHCVGVVKDFHAQSLREPITPMYLGLSRKMRFLSVKIKAAQTDEVIRYVKNVYENWANGYPFVYSFQDESFARQYDTDMRRHVLFQWFASLCIFIACLGLMGLVSLATRHRTREICVRKVAGASVGDIVLLLTKDFMKLIFLAFMVALPLSYLLMNNWLDGFAYHVSLSWDVFFISSMMALVIALLTISVHTLIAANKDPAKVLSYE